MAAGDEARITAGRRLRRTPRPAAPLPVTMAHFKITIAYDGTAFVGWQRQPDGVSVQGLLEDALATLDKRP